MNKESKNNLKWIMQYVLLAAIISYGSSMYTHGTNNKFTLLSPQQSKDVKDMITIFPDAIRYTIKFHDSKEYWECFRSTEETNPTFAGGIVLQLEKICSDYKKNGSST